MIFGIVSKSIDDPNFVAVWQGCQEAAKLYNDQCIHIGSPGDAHPRHQVTSMMEAINNITFDALAISVTKSEHIANALKNTTIPIITFDSPFDEQHNSISKSYVGMNNIEVGKDIAKIAKDLYPNGATICLMTTSHDPNHAQRIKGIRQELSDDIRYPHNKVLTGEKGWHECPRSPWNTADNVARTMNELSYTIEVIKPDLLLVSGHWPIVDIARYKKQVNLYKDKLVSGEVKILVTIGDINGVNQLLTDHLIHGYVQINFYNIGRYSYEMMRSLIIGKPIPETHYVKNIVKSIINK